MIDKRKKPRFGPLVVKARLDVDGETCEGYLTNLSAGGAFLAIDAPPSIGTEISIRAPLPWNLGELRARARVAWRNDPNAPNASQVNLKAVETKSPSSRPQKSANKILTADRLEPTNPTGVGVAFTHLEEGSQDMLHAYLQRFAELAAQLDEVNHGS